MNNKETKISLINKIKNFFKRIFNFNSNQKLLSEDTKIDLNDNFDDSLNSNTDFLKNIKTNVKYESDKSYKLKKFMKELEENPDLVENLSDDRLDDLISYYKKIVSEKEEKIKRLKKSLI